MREPYDDEDPPFAEPDPEVDALTSAIIGAAIEVHRHLGPGLEESLYQAALEIEFNLRNIAFLRQVLVEITGLKVGLLINFNTAVLKDGIKRIIRA